MLAIVNMAVAAVLTVEFTAGGNMYTISKLSNKLDRVSYAALPPASAAQ
ncbi:hypothetical protein GOY07_01945 [Wolbachia endosymbiont of Litomosoides sigmodontis]|nr:hypothetical protein GOY07_01945 [Wolbachia endosymbiont of Litomosoides sigmodontis]